MGAMGQAKETEEINESYYSWCNRVSSDCGRSGDCVALMAKKKLPDALQQNADKLKRGEALNKKAQRKADKKRARKVARRTK
jgi:hypothetical protein